MDRDRIKIQTERTCFIDEKLFLRVMGAEHCLSVVEEDGCRLSVGGGGREVKDDVAYVGSRERALVIGDGDDFSEEEPISPRFSVSVQQLKDKGKEVMMSEEGTGVQKVGKEVFVNLNKRPGCFLEDPSLNCQMVGSHVGVLGKRFEKRRDEVDKCLRLEGASFSVFPADKRLLGRAVPRVLQALGII